MRANIIIAAGLLLIAVIFTVNLKPADLQTGKAMITDRGIVTELYQTSFKDFVVKLKDNANSYYIDVEEDLSLEDLKNKLLYQPVTIQYPERWNANDNRHFVSKLETNGTIVYNDESD